VVYDDAVTSRQEEPVATLIITSGPANGQQFALGGHRLVMIGRDSECTFQILDAQMSRRHMQIKSVQETGGHVAIDFKSANGVLVNGQRIEGDTALRDGDEIHIGETCIVYTTGDSPDAKSVDSVLRKRGEYLKSTMVGDSDEG
jgi:pSer/pThr/pTyr-binding forkhead associated (FHA) protein